MLFLDPVPGRVLLDSIIVTQLPGKLGSLEVCVEGAGVACGAAGAVEGATREPGSGPHPLSPENPLFPAHYSPDLSAFLSLPVARCFIRVYLSPNCLWDAGYVLFICDSLVFCVVSDTEKTCGRY